MRTLKQVLATDPQERTEVEKAIQAAFWAGESHMRGKICVGLRNKFSSRWSGRYRLQERKAILSVISIPEVNLSFVETGSGDGGIHEAQEFLNWDFSI